MVATGVIALSQMFYGNTLRSTYTYISILGTSPSCHIKCLGFDGLGIKLVLDSYRKSGVLFKKNLTSMDFLMNWPKIVVIFLLKAIAKKLAWSIDTFDVRMSSKMVL